MCATYRISNGQYNTIYIRWMGAKYALVIWVILAMTVDASKILATGSSVSSAVVALYNIIHIFSSRDIQDYSTVTEGFLIPLNTYIPKEKKFMSREEGFEKGVNKFHASQRTRTHGSIP